MVKLKYFLVYPLRCTAFVHHSSIPSISYAPPKQIHEHYHAQKFTKLGMKWFDGLKSSSKKSSTPLKRIQILDHIGSGSYGTVHEAKFRNDSAGESLFVAKRAWTVEELRLKPIIKHEKDDLDRNSKPVVNEKTLKARAERCKYYLDVEYHIGSKIASDHVPNFVGKFQDHSGEHEWLLFEMINRSKDNKSTARSLKAIMDLDWIDQHGEEGHHHLYLIQKELGMDDSATFDETLDIILKGLLKCVVGVHGFNVAHRDIKPDNILITDEKFVLIDFGSAQDVDLLKKMVFVLDGEASVALSPIYAAPECFIEWDKAPLNFDVFSIGLVFCQLLFNLLDDRTDAAFRQQLEDADFDLDLWLERDLQATLRPAGIEDGLEYLGGRPGMWGLLKSMLQKLPKRRIGSSDALQVVTEILSDRVVNTTNERVKKDGSYFDYVIQDLDICSLPTELVNSDEDSNLTINSLPRPLHFVTTFDRSESLGLILSETDAVDDDDDYAYDEKWQIATADANQGDVFVRDLVKGGQAERLGIFEIGDRVDGVGGFPLQGCGFDGFVSMLGKVPQNSKTVKVHFDRRTELSVAVDLPTRKSNNFSSISVLSHGAWSAKGRRKSQEDTFVLHEVQSGNNNILLSGVFDGHGGDAASKSSSQLLPPLLSSVLDSDTKNPTPLGLALDTAWDLVCETYRDGCSIYGSGCLADFDSREGILYASTGSKDLVPGCTATVSAVRFDSGGAISDFVVLNCGDSRTIVAGEPLSQGSYTHFVTRDHVPSCPIEDKRLRQNENYSNPECSLNKFWLTVGDMRYALSRSLEGELATSKGIISESDVTTIDLLDLAASRTLGIIIQASDGLFDVIDTEEVSRSAVAMRKEGLSAQECAKFLCHTALQKKTSDNVSVIVVYLD